MQTTQNYNAYKVSNQKFNAIAGLAKPAIAGVAQSSQLLAGARQAINGAQLGFDFSVRSPGTGDIAFNNTGFANSADISNYVALNSSNGEYNNAITFSAGESNSVDSIIDRLNNLEYKGEVIDNEERQKRYDKEHD